MELERGSLAEESIAPLAQQQIQEWSNKIDGEPDDSDPEDLLNDREIILQDHECHPDMSDDGDEKAGEDRDPRGTPNWSIRTTA